MEKYQFWLKCWGICFGVLSLVFSFYVFHFILGNHDWQYIRYGMPPWHGLFEARITQYLPPYFLLKGQILPILGTIFGFLFFSGGAVLLAKWYGIPEKYGYVLLFLFLIVLNPYICSQLYYTYLSLSFFCWHFLCILGIVWTEIFCIKYDVKYLIGAFLCFFVSLCGYVPCLELIFTCYLGKFIIEFTEGKSCDNKFWKKYILSCVVILSCILIYAAFIAILKRYDIVSSSVHNTKLRTLSESFTFLVDFWQMPFKVLIKNIPFTVWYVPTVLLGLSCLALWVGLKNNRKRLFFMLVFLLLFYVVFACAYISPHPIFFAHQVNAYSVPYQAAIWFVLALKGTKIVKNMALVLAFLLFSFYAKIDFMTQKVWLLGTQQNDKLVERVKSRFLPQIDFNEHYRISIVGDPNGRQKFAEYKGDEEEKNRFREYYGYGTYLSVLFSSYFFLYERDNPVWADSMFLGNDIVYKPWNEMILPEDKIKAELFAMHFGNDREKLIDAADKLCSYPCQNFYYVGEKDILLMVSDDEISRLVLKWNIKNQ